ncbi:hypothetical protein [Sphingobium yanoikuyae]|uniref:hypothetical protein n=1 Tax=Sphingobium yanoikuyae TaxID=13690 RepID=UPI0026E9C452|nr:hypothetical protein [Sphingobium yanoikuyae]
MNVGEVAKIALEGIAALIFLWLAWQTVRTGLPAGSVRMNPRRDERPVRFWLLVCLYIGLAVWNGSLALGF